MIYNRTISDTGMSRSEKTLADLYRTAFNVTVHQFYAFSYGTSPKGRAVLKGIAVWAFGSDNPEEAAKVNTPKFWTKQELQKIAEEGTHVNR